MKHLISILLVAVAFLQPLKAADFVTTRGTQFFTPDAPNTPYYFIGTNFWYAPILASEGQGGNRDRLSAELKELKRLGINNLRILVGADTGSANANTVTPYLQSEPGVLNDTLLDGLDYLVKEMEELNLYGVFYLTNSWDWSGGFGFYLKNTGHSDSPNAEGEGYDAYLKYASEFSKDKAAQELFFNFTRAIVSRTNRYTNKPYKESPAIMSWQLCNEPRPFADDAKEGFEEWIVKAAKIIKSIDPNHLVSVGSEGLVGCENDLALYERIHNVPEIDYLTIHIWPVNWGWSSRGALFTSLPNVYVKATEYIEKHVRIAKKCNKPLVIEEFGYPRNNNFFSPGTKTDNRDSFYKFVFEQVVKSKAANGAVAGVNFWGWGGAGRPQDRTWKHGNDYLCDPPHEPQGWYSVFDNDTTTISCITNAVEALNQTNQ